MKLYSKLLTTMISAAFVVGLVLMPGAASAVDFSGKTIKLVIPFKEGSSTDRYSRLFAHFFEKHLPGKPKILLVHKPGGSGIKAANWFDSGKAKPDGLTIMAVSTSNHTSFVFGGKKVKYNELKWRPIVLTPQGTCYYAASKAGVTGKDPVADIKLLRKGKWIVSGKNPTSSELRVFLALDMLGINNITPLFGISTGNRRKSIVRGEVHIGNDAAGSCLTKTRKLEKRGKVNIFMTLGFVKPDGSIVRDPAMPNNYTFSEAYKAVNGKAPSGLAWDMMKHLTNMAVMASKSLVLPKGTPDDIVNAYIAAAKKSIKDPAFMKKAKKAARIYKTYPQSFGADAANVYKHAVDVSPEAKAWMTKWINRKFNASL